MPPPARPRTSVQRAIWIRHSNCHRAPHDVFRRQPLLQVLTPETGGIMKAGWARDAAKVPPAELPQTLPLVRVIAMPADANPNGDIFGGWLLSQMDLAGGSLAAQRARGGARPWRSTAWCFTSRSLSGTRS